MIDISKIVLCVFEKKMFCLLEYDKKKTNKQSAIIHTHIQWDFLFFIHSNDKNKNEYDT